MEQEPGIIGRDWFGTGMGLGTMSFLPAIFAPGFREAPLWTFIFLVVVFLGLFAVANKDPPPSNLATYLGRSWIATAATLINLCLSAGLVVLDLNGEVRTSTANLIWALIMLLYLVIIA